MKDQFLTYEIAKRLKELGFIPGWYCACYDTMRGNQFEATTGGHLLDDKFKERYIIAPLWQQAIDWLRDKHKILVEPWRGTSGKYYVKIVIDFSKTHIGSGNFSFYTNEAILNNGWKGFSTYEQARQAAIEKALTLI
jgi:hypothetical protein